MLSDSERNHLSDIAGAMIPADAALGKPSANDPAILAYIEKSIGRDLAAVRTALASYGAGQDVNTWYKSGGGPAMALGRIVCSAYYRDDRVLLALGHEARAPFPKGYTVEQGDWSLLDAVKSRRQFWRQDR